VNNKLVDDYYRFRLRGDGDPRRYGLSGRGFDLGLLGVTGDRSFAYLSTFHPPTGCRGARLTKSVAHTILPGYFVLKEILH
jgi:hypothetical protein